MEKIKKNLSFDINYIGFSFENGFKYLNVELPDNDLINIENKSKIISKLIDQIDKSDEFYYLNVYSAGSEKEILINDLKNHLNKNILIKTCKEYFKKTCWEGKLLDVNENTFTLFVNNKGRFQKLIIEKTQCEYVQLTAKYKKEKF